ncbi:ubiquitin-conjugating enzyme E2 I [Plasmodium ovale wallikeri]|uniref:Ubiquitin-conjugating enzyme E2 I n=1 Tax=Plasmodium ovale wallikeri TaxID=864142 RepID=A0A1A8Z5X4_PLAOA|nr:ubiquitin-conjugating enzyme E2 I [Plasmodium ovale wallikeri]SBT44592.1 ubiquitin-conjugating enzyme E2 I [Plasmodium ovale wallikeri]
MSTRGCMDRTHSTNAWTHTHIHDDYARVLGELCMDILKSNWSPAWTIQSLCRAILFLFTEPNAESPLNCDAGFFFTPNELYISLSFLLPLSFHFLTMFARNLLRSGDVRGFQSMAKMYTHEYAMQKD